MHIIYMFLVFPCCSEHLLHLPIRKNLSINPSCGQVKTKSTTFFIIFELNV